MIQATHEIDKAMKERARTLPVSLQPLERLSWNYWWSWAPDGPSVFRDLDPETWEECEQNPRRLLKEATEFRLMQMATDPIYIKRVQKLAAGYDEYMNPNSKTWSRRSAKKITEEKPVAYFCAEYGIHNSLPLYSGGLGMLAGDHLKSASDLGLPLIAIGLLYRYGYFRQRLSREGWQEEHYGAVESSDLPIHLIREKDGSPVRVEVLMRGRIVRAQVWRADIGRIPLYLLDTNIPENNEVDRWVTGHLYGGDRETRVVQEMMLGIGGVRLLRRLNIEPQVYHLNEGHSAFLTLELARELIEKKRLKFLDAMLAVRNLSVFTTHTPIAAGNDEFDPSLIDKCFGQSYWDGLGITRDEFLGLGRVTKDDTSASYGLTPLAIKMCRSTNGVSRKHGEVSRALWRGLWPDRNFDEVPITSITNGVHVPSWIAPILRSIFETHIGKDWAERINDTKRWTAGVEKIADEELWLAHSILKQQLIAFIRHRTYYSRLQNGFSLDYAESARELFNPDYLTIGFARRVAGYKRWGLILKDQERLLKILTSDERPVQIVFAGKAHPQDVEAKAILQRLAQWKNDPRARNRTIFIQDYDQDIARHLVHAVDVWLNVPRRPLEASGTSGQKVAMNGGLNFSVLDGWWIEGYDGNNGWSIGESMPDTVIEDEDASDAESLYRTLERNIIPVYYDRDAKGIPHNWIKMMKHSIATLAPAFNSDRMVQEYVEKIYQ
jgi:glycogen phosphorylase